MPRSAPPSKPAKSLGPRIDELAKLLGSGASDARVKSAACELAMLASRSISACMTVADAKIEPQLSGVLSTSKDPTTQCWTMSILSNCASLKESRERQAVAVPALCKLIASPVPEVQHAAALHLATLSHSAAVQKAFAANGAAVRMLHDIEGLASKALSKPGAKTLQQEAAQYARWTLRTPQGRRHKPDFVPKSHEEVEMEQAVAIQARVRSSFVANAYRKEMQQRRAAATILQAGYRSHHARDDMAKEILVQGPAVALMQGFMRGKLQRKSDAEARRRARAEQDNAAARVQAIHRGRVVRSGKGAVAPNGGTAVAGDPVINLSFACSDGTYDLPLFFDDDSEPVHTLSLWMNGTDGRLAIDLDIC